MSQYRLILNSSGSYAAYLEHLILLIWRSHLIEPVQANIKARGGGGGVKVDFPVFTYLIRAAGDEQEEKNRTEI